MALYIRNKLLLIWVGRTYNRMCPLKQTEKVRGVLSKS